MATANQLLDVLSRHIGADNGISAEALARRLGLSPDQTRQVRLLVEELRKEGKAICAHPQTGYFTPRTREELERYYIRFLEARARTSEIQLARARRIALPDFTGQAHLPI